MPSASKPRRKYDKNRPVRFVNDYQDIHVTSELALSASVNTLAEVERDARQARHARELAAALKQLGDQLDAFASRWLPEAFVTREEYEHTRARLWSGTGDVQQLARQLWRDRAWALWHEDNGPRPEGTPEAIRRENFREAVLSLRQRLQEKLTDLSHLYRVPLVHKRGRPSVHPTVAMEVDLMFALGLSDSKILSKLRGLSELKLAPSTREGVRQLRRRWRGARPEKPDRSEIAGVLTPVRNRRRF
jgi:hypothetical protein